MPIKIDPNTPTIRIVGGTIDFRTLRNNVLAGMAALSSFERAGPSSGLIQHLIRIYIIYIVERIRPGIMAPAKSFPTERAA